MAHVKLYIGLFQPRGSEELSALSVDNCRYVSVCVTNNDKYDVEYMDKKCNEINRSIQTKTSNYVDDDSILCVKKPFSIYICPASKLKRHLMVETQVKVPFSKPTVKCVRKINHFHDTCTCTEFYNVDLYL